MTEPIGSTDPAQVGRRLHARVLIRDSAGRVLTVRDPAVLPGGPLLNHSRLTEAAREDAERATGLQVDVGRPLTVKVDRESGLTIIFDGGAAEEPLGPGARFVPAGEVPGAEDAVQAQRDGRIRYSEELWWPIKPASERNQSRPSFGALLREVTDDDVASWALGLIVETFPSDSYFYNVRGIWWRPRDPQRAMVEALHTVLMDLADIGVLDEDAELEFRSSDRVDVEV